MLNQVFDPSIQAKMVLMERQVCWRDALLLAQGVDQTRLVIEDGEQDQSAFSFLVMGDTDAGNEGGLPQAMAMAMATVMAQQDCRLVLHTGDVAYPMGAVAQYLKDFMEGYCGQMMAQGLTFKLPVLPVPGNHDYYDRGGWRRLVIKWLPSWLRAAMNKSARGGRAYSEMFLDCLAMQGTPEMLRDHLELHYRAKTETGYCLQYEPGLFTRLPNRYYGFRYGGVEFFALDSNTFNRGEGIDREQMDWFRQGLVASWQDPTVSRRIVYFHHAPYTTEAVHYNQSETLAVRRNFRAVLDRVKGEMGEVLGDRPVVDLVLSGHAHCFEHLRTGETGHGDRGMDWVVCGGSGMSLRSQRAGGRDVTEMIGERGMRVIRQVARSQVYVGRGERLRHSFLRVDVGSEGGLVLVPMLLERFRGEWGVREGDQILI